MQTERQQRRISSRIAKLENESTELAIKGLKSLALAELAKSGKDRAARIRVSHNCKVACQRLRERITKLSERLIPTEESNRGEYPPKLSGIKYNGHPLGCMA